MTDAPQPRSNRRHPSRPRLRRRRAREPRPDGLAAPAGRRRRCVAEQDGVIVAALAGERAIADPFRPTADLVALLRMHAGRPRTSPATVPRARAPPARRVTPSLSSPSPQRRRPDGAVRTPWSGRRSWTVYIVWGSTYLALRVLVETIPPLISTGSRFLLAGAPDARRARAAPPPPCGSRAREPLGCLLVGSLMMGAVATVATAEQDVPSNLAALLVACVPLWVLVLRRLGGERIAPRLVLAVIDRLRRRRAAAAAGRADRRRAARRAAARRLLDAGVGDRLLPLPPRALPAHPLVSVGWQMLLGGGVVTLAGVVAASRGAWTRARSRRARRSPGST